MKTLSIIVPVYNEVATIDTILKRVTATRVPGWKKEIIVVDDGSTDGTREHLAKWRNRCRVQYKTRNEGKGSAIIAGLPFVSGDIVLIQDADLEYNPTDYLALLKPFDNPSVDVVYGSRFLGPHLSTQFVYAMGNRFITFITDFLYNTNISDSETGYKVFRRSVISGLLFHSKRFNFDQEFTAKILKRNYRILEVPISYIGRGFCDGKKLTWKDGIVAIIALLRYRVMD
jgi:glycosyltransferase involved in cell wall biosynthesis